MPVSMGQYIGDAFAVEKISVGTGAASGTDEAVHSPSGATKPKGAFLSIESNPIRFYSHGSDPTSTDGHEIPAGGNITISGHRNVADLKMIAIGGAATVQITYLR